MDIVIAEVTNLRDALTRRAVETVDTPIVGRTHGMHAEPTTYGQKFALFALQVDRDLERANKARRAIAVGKLSGAVGTFSNIDPSVEAYVCQHLGLEAVPATQVIARDRHAEVLYACAAIGTSIEQFALEVRLLARSEVGEMEEPFAPGQKGSSAMPHKRNPVVAERLVGLARVLRGYLQAGLEDVALWHERDISHSSVERIVLPDALQLTVYMLRKATWLADGAVVHAERALANLTESSLGLVFSQSVLLALIESGMNRDEAYHIVQKASRAAIEQRRNFREVIEGDDEVALTDAAIARAFDLDRLLTHRRRILESLTWRT
jgi:adenylosuccinate lyase